MAEQTAAQQLAAEIADAKAQVVRTEQRLVGAERELALLLHRQLAGLQEEIAENVKRLARLEQQQYAGATWQGIFT
jgi:hypothetical protein